MGRLAIVVCSGTLGCSGAVPGPSLGGAVDQDGDGWAISDGDCDDDDDDVNPHAVDWPGDGEDQDCDGADDEALAMWGVRIGDLVITEVMMDPVGVSSDLGEWFEIQNGTEVDIDLDGMLVRDLGGDDFVVAGPLLVASAGYVVMGVWADEAINGGVPVDYRYSANFALSNAEDAIRLEFDGALLESVTWDGRFPRTSGRSMALQGGASAADNDSPDLWCTAQQGEPYGIGGYGTPGEDNGDCPPPIDGLGVEDLNPGDLVITEIMQNPALVPDEDGEWFEVYNNTGVDIDLTGLEITDDDEDERFTVTTRIVAPADGYVVFGADDDEEDNGGVAVDAIWGSDYELANSSQAIVLRFGAQVIDRVDYDNGETFPDPIGASMSLDPGSTDGTLNDKGNAWCIGTLPYGGGDLGSPGVANPDC